MYSAILTTHMRYVYYCIAIVVALNVSVLPCEVWLDGDVHIGKMAA